MGGLGSGRRRDQGARRTTEDLPALDVRALKREGKIAPGQEQLGGVARLVWTPRHFGGEREAALRLPGQLRWMRPKSGDPLRGGPRAVAVPKLPRARPLEPEGELPTPGPEEGGEGAEQAGSRLHSQAEGHAPHHLREAPRRASPGDGRLRRPLPRAGCEALARALPTLALGAAHGGAPPAGRAAGAREDRARPLEANLLYSAG